MPRTRKFRGRKRFLRRGGRIGRAHTRLVRAVFEVEQLRGSTMVPGASAFGNYNNIDRELNGWQNTSGGPEAVMYCFTFPLSFLGSLGPTQSNYLALAQLYDFFKLYKVKCSFIPQLEPKQAITIGNQPPSTIYNFTTWPGESPVITYIERDGWGAMPSVGAVGGFVCPVNGDCTALIYNKEGARKHNPWKTIRRTFYPRCIPLVGGDSSSGVTTTPSGMGTKRMGWMTSRQSNAWTGNLIMAIPYLGQDSALQTLQPNFNYNIVCKWFIGLKTPLYG